MNLFFLIQLTETDKRIIIALCLVLILVFVLIGLLGSLIIRTMKWQGKKCDTLVSDVVTHKIITNSKQLKKYARKKNSRYFLKQAWIPVLFMVIAGLIYVIHNAVIKDWSYNPFNIETGFGSLFFVWDFSDPDLYTEVFGFKVLAKWPDHTINDPHLVKEAICAYIAVPFAVVGFIWYMVAAQAYLARTIRMHQLSKQVFEKSLEGFNGNTQVFQQNPQPEQTSDHTEINI